MKSCAYTPAPLEKGTLLDAVCHRLRYDFAKNWEERSRRDLFQSVALTVRDQLVERLLGHRSPLPAGGCQAALLSLH